MQSQVKRSQVRKPVDERFRGNEAPALRFRTERVHRVNGQWYFHTREGISVGPYRTEFEAVVEADLLKNKLTHTPPEQARRVVGDFFMDSTTLVASEQHLGDGALADYVVNESSTELTLESLLGHR